MDSTNHNGVWWLAQAPGPNTPSVPTQVYIQDSDRNIASSSASWLDTWKDTWNPIGSPGGSSSATSTSSPSSGSSGTALSTGAIAGIGTGAAIAALALIALGVFFVRKRKWEEISSGTTQKSGGAFSWHDYEGAAGFGPQEMEGRETRDPAELDPRRVLDRILGRRYELGDTQRPAELSGWPE